MLIISYLRAKGNGQGELVALKSSDIEGDYIHVQRQETRVFEDVDAEHSKIAGYQIVDYTKSDAGDRYVPIIPGV